MFHSMELHPITMQTIAHAVAQLQHSQHLIRTLISSTESAWYISDRRCHETLWRQVGGRSLCACAMGGTQYASVEPCRQLCLDTVPTRADDAFPQRMWHVRDAQFSVHHSVTSMIADKRSHAHDIRHYIDTLTA